MNKNLIIILGVVLVIGLLLMTMFITPKETVFKEELLGIDYMVEGNETSLNYDTENPVVAMYIMNYGSIVIELYPYVAPNTVNNFISLVKKGFYDGNSFHRLMPGFVLQGGDPDGNGSGGPGYSIKGEFTANGFENNLAHEKWVVSMARATDPDSAGSQFFICIDDARASLDGSYAAFGKVIDGFAAIEEIEKNEKIADTESGKLKDNLKISKALVDLKGKEYPEPEIIPES
jgi:peptidyl-prolyl cis-trans isomerase B (cyclophilin B)